MGKKESKKEEIKVYSSIDKKIEKLQIQIKKLQARR